MKPYMLKIKKSEFLLKNTHHSLILIIGKIIQLSISFLFLSENFFNHQKWASRLMIKITFSHYYSCDCGQILTQNSVFVCVGR